MNPRFHVEDDLLMAYAAGAMAEPMQVLIATHLALCPHCRSRSETFDAVGGVMLEDLDEVPVEPGVRDAVMARLDTFEDFAPSRPREKQPVDLRVPQPLRGYLDGGLDDLAWRTRGPVDEVRILTEHEGYTSRLFRIKAGRAMPQHTHEGNELTLVLAGGFRDGADHYLRGDVATADAHVDHRPVADADEDCYCLAVYDAPLRLTGSFAGVLNRLIRI